jgi:lipoate-protein ligase A
MAADYALLLAAQQGEAWFRLYCWNPACLSFGRNEPATIRYDRDRIAELGLDAVRRPTGGRAVWHDAEVTYAVAAPVDAFGSLDETYHVIHQMLSRALQRLGMSTTLATRPAGGHQGLAAGACFASPAGGEIVVSGRKLVGSAQVREGSAFLQHGSILLDDGQDLVSHVTRGTGLPSRATSLSASLRRSVSFQEVTDGLAAEVKAGWDGDWTSSSREPDRALVDRFADPGWTWRR